MAKYKYIEQIFIYGDSLQSHLVAILVQNSRNVIKLLKSKGIENVTKENYKDYYEDPDLIKDILKEINDYNKKMVLKDLKLLKNFICVKNLSL